MANPDIADVVNTIQKMGTKRAYIAATLSATGASQWFTQDIAEDSRDAPSPDDAPKSSIQPKAPIPPPQNYAPEVPEALQEMYGELAKGIGETIAIFGEFKALLGDLTGSDHYYYEILERGEMKHGNDLKGKTRGSVKKVISELYYAVEKLRAEPVLPPSDENGNADDMPVGI